MESHVPNRSEAGGVAGGLGDGIFDTAPAEWCALIVSLAFLRWFLAGSRRLIWADGVSIQVRNEYALSLRSAVIYVAMVLPIMVFRCTKDEDGNEVHVSWANCPKSPYWFIPTNFMKAFHWLPFYFSFMVSTNFGAWRVGVFQAGIGILMALAYVVLMNFLMPGGAGGLSHYGQKFVDQGLLYYNISFTWICALAFVFAVFLLGFDTGIKQYALGLFSNMLVLFMNPRTDRGFRAVVFDWKSVNWNGPMLCEVWVVVVAMALSLLAVNVWPCGRRAGWRQSCLEYAAADLSDLAKDTEDCLGRLLTSWRNNTLNFDIDSSYRYIRQLGARRTATEALLSQSGEGNTAQMRLLWKLADMLRHLRQNLRVELDVVRSLGHTSREPREGQLAEYLEDFLQACGDAINSFAAQVKTGHDFDQVSMQRVSEATKKAQAALGKAIEDLKAAARIAQTELGPATVAQISSLAFLDRLMSWPACISRILHEVETEPIEEYLAAKGSHDAPTANDYSFAVRNTFSWVLALLWSIYKRNYNSGCVVGVSFIFSATSGSSFDRNINRMVGVGMGLVVGNIPAILIMKGDFENTYIRLTIYAIAMLATWAVAIYGYLATGSKYSYACLLWVGYAGVHMLRHIPNFDRARGLIMDVMDNYLSCLIVFVVDITYAYCAGTSTLEQVRDAVCSCMQHTASIVEGFQAGHVVDVDIEVLQSGIKRARFWDGELRREGLVWTRLWEAPYNKDTVRALLDHCDEVYVAAYAMQASAKRCGSKELVATVLGEVLSEDLPRRCYQDVQATRALLTQNLSKQQWDELFEKEPPPMPDMATMLSNLPPNEAAASCQAAAVALRVGAMALRGALWRIRRLLTFQAELQHKDLRAAVIKSADGPRGDLVRPPGQAQDGSVIETTSELRRRRRRASAP